MAKKYEEVEINGEKVYLRKWVGWKVIHPVVIDGKINWKNLIAGGNWFNLLILAFILFVIIGLISEYSTAVNIANECLNNSHVISLNNAPTNEYWNLVP